MKKTLVTALFAASSLATATALASDAPIPTYQSCGGQYPNGMYCTSPTFLGQPYTMNEAYSLLTGIGCSLAANTQTEGVYVCGAGTVWLIYGTVDGWAHTVVQI